MHGSNKTGFLRHPNPSIIIVILLPNETTISTRKDTKKCVTMPQKSQRIGRPRTAGKNSDVRPLAFGQGEVRPVTSCWKRMPSIIPPWTGPLLGG